MLRGFRPVIVEEFIRSSAEKCCISFFADFVHEVKAFSGGFEIVELAFGSCNEAVE